MVIYKQEDIQKMKKEFITVKSRYADLLVQIVGLSAKLREEKAREYLVQGAGRRWDLLEICIENIFLIYPPEREKLLCREELINIAINLHAFLINIFGLLDNLAWVPIQENNLANNIDKRKVGLFKTETRRYLPNKFCQYLDSPRMKSWHKNYLINYRDALSHRIPLYVPPQILNTEQKEQLLQMDQEIIECYKTLDFAAIEKFRKQQLNIGTPCPFFVHSSFESKHVLLHPQILADFNTIEEIITKYCEMYLNEL